MTEFKIEAKKILEDLIQLVENKYENFEVDYEGENLVIQSINEDSTFIINLHEPTSQIWLSSPISGAHHFEKNKASTDWISTRNSDVNLINILEKELKVINGK